jgi:hypothetical protein
MWHPSRLSAVALLALVHLPASAQEAGGVFIPAGVLSSANVPVITPPGFPFTHSGGGISPAGPPNVGSAASRQAVNQQLVAQTRGDGGFLEGFLNGQPLAASRAPAVNEVPVIINNTPYFFNSQGGPVSVDLGSNNIVQQQVAAQPAGDLGQHQAVNIATTAGAGQNPGQKAGQSAGQGRVLGGRTRGAGTSITNGGGSTVVAGANATAQQQVLTIAGPARLPRTPIVQQQGH